MFLQSGNKTECTGCGSCVDVCPQGCIELKADNEGFLYPYIDNTKCINCHLCEKVCPNDIDGFLKENQGVWAGLYNDNAVVHKSSSGGAFTAIYTTLIKEGYTVYGVKFDENLKVVHDSAKTTSECEAFRKSKYILSDTNHCFQKIGKQLLNNEKVLFTGTPCQCGSLLKYLNIKKIQTSNLITVDLICHGAPSQNIFDDYIKELELRENSSVVNYSFKNKLPYKNKINTRTAYISFENGTKKIVGIFDDPFLKGYYSRLFYRPSCAECKFAKPQRVADLTIGDAWQIEDIYPSWNSLEGVSLILANSENGVSLVDLVKTKMTLETIELDWAIKANSQLARPTEMHRNRKKFFKINKKLGFEKAVQKATKVTLVRRLLSKIKSIIKRS